jgi:hypothetical protein
MLEPEAILDVAHARVASLLTNPHVSDWLKDALRAAHGHDAVQLQNDIEILRCVIAPIVGSSLEIALRPLTVT